LGINPDVRWLLKLHGAWDLVEPYICQSPEEVLERMSINSDTPLKYEREFISIQQEGHQTILSFFGRLLGTHILHNKRRQLGTLIDGRTCTIDLTYCTSITNPGFGFLLELSRLSAKQHQPLIIKNANKNLKRQFKNSQLKKLFQFEN
jgi:hypothetical protein